MQGGIQANAFEVYCNRCRVTFPAGTRRCLHCGGRLSRERGAAELALPPAVEAEDEEEGIPRRRGVSPVAGIWLLLALLATLYRACAGG